MIEFPNAIPRPENVRAGDTRSLLDFIPSESVRTAIRVGSNSTDLSAYFTDAVAALPEGGRLLLPFGTYDIADWQIGKTIEILGEGYHNSAPSIIRVAAGSKGITLLNAAQGSSLRNFAIQGQAVSAGSDHGLIVEANGVYAEQLWISGFGGNGVHSDTGTVAGKNADSCHFNRVFVKNCYGNGFHFRGIDSNQNLFSACSAQTNRGWGFYIDYEDPYYTFNHTLNNCHTEGNRLGSYYINGESIVLINPYAEPDGAACNVTITGTSVVRNSGQAFAASWVGIGLQIGGSGYGPVVSAVADADHLTIEPNGFEAMPANGTYDAMIRINQRMEFGPQAQYCTVISGSRDMNAPRIAAISPAINKARIVGGGTNNKTHTIVQQGSFYQRMAVKGRLPERLIIDERKDQSGTCNTSGGASITNVSGDAWDVTMINTPITISGTAYLVTGYTSPTQISVGSFSGGPSNPGAALGLQWTMPRGRTYLEQIGIAADRAWSMQDVESGLVYDRYDPAFGRTFQSVLSLVKKVPRLVLSDQSVGGTTYAINSGQAGAGDFEIEDATAGASVILYDKANAKIYFAPIGIFNNGIDIGDHIRYGGASAGAVKTDPSGFFQFGTLDLSSNTYFTGAGADGYFCTALGGRIAGVSATTAKGMLAITASDVSGLVATLNDHAARIVTLEGQMATKVGSHSHSVSGISTGSSTVSTSVYP